MLSPGNIQVDLNALVPNDSVRSTREIMTIRDKLLAKSDMADEIVRVFDLWNEGVLIMDEVDVLLHPLKSELNFPIGQKIAIDLSGYRWELPIFLLDAVFYHHRGATSGDTELYRHAETQQLFALLPSLLPCSLLICWQQHCSCHK